MFDETKELPVANAVMAPSCCSDSHGFEDIPTRNAREGAGFQQDVGFQRALTEWVIQHRSRRSAQAEAP